MAESRLMEMLTGYAAAHRHPLNIAVHMVGIPAIMFGALIALSWIALPVGTVSVSLAWLLLIGFFVFYLTLDTLFAIVFLLLGSGMTFLAGTLAEWPMAQSGSIAAALFFGGYIAQFVGHAIEKSPPVLLKHPVQAQLAAPFFTIVELFKLLGLREQLFNDVQDRIARQQDSQSAAPTSG